MCAALILLATLPAAPVTDVKLPPGFTANLFSDRDLANDIYTTTIDDAGRVFVAGRGYVKELVDDNGDGTADRAVVLLNNLKDGPMGLLAEGDSLYVVADGGLKRYSGLNSRALGKPELIYAVKSSGEHEAHAVRRGPDGWLYLMCGNMSGVKKEHLDPVRSPVKDPVAGSLLRISPDGKTIEAVADGFRNAYGFDFNLEGEAFTFDSDNERCVGLPWYEPCRFYHVVPGGNYGWRSPQLSQTWRKPPYFADVVPPIGVTGRGSPTGVACYRNTLFPSPYRGGFFIADWTFGKIWFVPLEKKHSSYVGKPEVFLEAVGESGFAPTALAVHPKTGELFISIGGRGTRGAVYRIGHSRGGPVAELPIANRSLEWNEGALKEWLAEAAGNDALKRRHALDDMLRYRDKIGWGEWLGDAVRPNLSHDNPLIRAAAARMAVQAAAPVGPLRDPDAKLAVALLMAEESPELAMPAALEQLASSNSSLEQKLIATRVIQLAFGDLSEPSRNGTIGEGYTFRRELGRAWKDRVAAALWNVVEPLKEQKSITDLDREVARIAGALGGEEAVGAREIPRYRLAMWMGSKLVYSKTAEDAVHFLAALNQMTRHSLRDADTVVAAGLLDLHQRLVKQKISVDRNWPLRYEELAAGLIPKVFHLADVLAGRKREIELPAHLSIVRHLRMKPEEKATLILDRAGSRFGTWNQEMLEMVSVLPMADLRPILKELWDRGGFEDSIIPIFAKDPLSSDGPKLIIGLRSMNPEVVRLSAAALLKIEPQKEKADVIAAIIAMRKFPEDKGPRDALVALLKDRTGQNHADGKAWAAWFAKAHPELAAKLNTADGFDAAAWAKREPNIPWLSGDAVRGRAVFAKATCASCHDGGGAIGPSLAGVGKRFSRDDLLTAILQPSKDVSPRYRPTRISTTDGKVHIGMIVYEAVSGVILQTGPDAVVRIDGTQIESQKLLETSLMPAGLLEKLTDAEIADLLAYLRSG